MAPKKIKSMNCDIVSASALANVSYEIGKNADNENKQKNDKKMKQKNDEADNSKSDDQVNNQDASDIEDVELGMSTKLNNIETDN